MSDSSEDEDLSRFRDAVDTSFLNDAMFEALNNEVQQNKTLTTTKPILITQPKSERYLETESHYNDVKVSTQLQNRIGNKLSEIINKTIEYVDFTKPVEKTLDQCEGGVRLFSESKTYLSHEVAFDEATASHNIKNKGHKRKNRIENEEHYEKEKVKLATVSADEIFSGQETKHWKSRRKEKLFRYKKSKGKGKVLISIDT